ncbi:ABC transporter substrate-binding protein, partial [Alloscardovia theropitheci]|uniref:ABC transporter substrate-binding protein n=1 Tax=Alloscardovia theropitheci TaxID=2496842 RepID=UPI001F0FB2E9
MMPRTRRMRKQSLRKLLLSATSAVIASLLAISLAACGQTNSSRNAEGLKNVTFMLSWIPDTNHIGAYIAAERGYFKDEGL